MKILYIGGANPDANLLGAAGHKLTSINETSAVTEAAIKACDIVIWDQKTPAKGNSFGGIGEDSDPHSYALKAGKTAFIISPEGPVTKSFPAHVAADETLLQSVISKLGIVEAAL